MQNEGKSKSDLKGLSFAYRISSELVAALIVSVILGLTLDKFLDTKHIALITIKNLQFCASITVHWEKDFLQIV